MNNQEYMTLDEASAYIGIKRGSLPYQLKRLGIKVYRFPLSKPSYITRADAEHVKQVKEKPWLANKEKEAA